MTKENEALTPRHEAPADDGPVFHMNLLSHEDNEAWLESARRVAAKHEAPAEGAGEREALAAIMQRNMIPDDDGGFSFHDLKAADQIMDYLRARSSAPEAREEALGNLLAVIHGDGGHRALEVGTKQAALEAEKIVANLLSSAPEAREGLKPQVRPMEDTLSAFGVMKDHFVGASSRPVTHPAAQSGDKLRIAVEALETSRENLIGWFEAIDAEIRVEHEMHVSLKDDLAVIDQALAALKAEGA